MKDNFSGMSASSATATASAPARRPWPPLSTPGGQAAPLAAVFVVFFLVPLALVLMVSFWDLSAKFFRCASPFPTRQLKAT